MTGRSRLLFQARLFRRTSRRWLQAVRYHRPFLHGVPIMFANSFPKSGTHLLTQVLEGFPLIGPAVNSGLPAITTFRADTGHQRPMADILKDLQRLLPGDVAFGHLHALPEVTALLTRNGVASFFILRDPRDVVISHVHYITEMEPDHIHHRYYTQELHNFDQRLRTSIMGLPDPQIPFPDIRQRFDPFVSWLEQPSVLVLRFEDFVIQREIELTRVLDHALSAGFPLRISRPEALRLLDQNINPSRSPTFRSGKIGGWKSQFNLENKQLFKNVTGDLLIRLGYEQGNNW